LVASTAGAVAACNALTGASDLAIDDACATDACEAGLPPRAGDPTAGTPPGAPPGTPPGTPQTGLDAGLDGGAGDASPQKDGSADANPPTYCGGIVFYARFDGALTTAEGVEAEAPLPPVTFGAGKFGKAVLLSGTSAGVFYPVGGGLTYPAAEGTVAMWVNPSWTYPSTKDRTFFKAPANRDYVNTNNGGPELGARDGQRDLGLYTHNAVGSMTTAMIPKPDVEPVWKDLGWNHLVAAWRLAPSYLAVSLNGATSGAVGHVTSTAAWTAQAPAAYMRVGSDVGTPDASFDDVAVWNRILSEAEVHALYASAVPIGDACGL
jgi:hypothetical protein